VNRQRREINREGTKWKRNVDEGEESSEKEQSEGGTSMEERYQGRRSEMKKERRRRRKEKGENIGREEVEDSAAQRCKPTDNINKETSWKCYKVKNKRKRGE
jgi:hypothetical protein